MGQEQSAQNNDDSCFRVCLHNKNEEIKKYKSKHKQKINKINPQKEIQIKSTLKTTKLITNDQLKAQKLSEKNKVEEITFSNKNLIRKEQTTSSSLPEIFPKDEQKNIQTEIVITEANDGFLNLGLQSKMSSVNKKAFYHTPTRQSLTKENSISNHVIEPIASLHSIKQTNKQLKYEPCKQKNGASYQKLICRIQEMKEKYFERELEIQIYQNEEKYVEELNQITKIQNKVKRHPNIVSEKSIQDISYLKEQILQKLSKKKEGYLKKLDQKKNDGQFFNILDELNESTKQKSIIKNLNKSENKISTLEFNKNLNKSISKQLDVTEKVQFSQYSNESLHQIKQLDQQNQSENSSSKVPEILEMHNQAIKRQSIVQVEFNDDSANQKMQEWQKKGEILKQSKQKEVVKIIDVQEPKKTSFKEISQNQQKKQIRSTRNSMGSTQKQNKIILF